MTAIKIGKLISGSVVLLFATLLLLAADHPRTMIQATVRLMGPGIKPGSFAALPKTIYRAGTHYARIEDPPDARQQIQKLTIIAEPDAYSVNLIDKKGIHAIDQGRGEDPHLPVVFDPTRKLTKLNHLEFGDELEFFQTQGAKKGAGPIINAKPTDAYHLPAEEGEAVLVTRAGTSTPVELSWRTKNGAYRYEYITYKEMPFDATLFSRPKGIQFREIPPDPNSDKEEGRN